MFALRLKVMLLALSAGLSLPLSYSMAETSGVTTTANEQTEQNDADGVNVVPDTPILLPSGLEAQFNEVRWNEPGLGLTLRYRFVVPEISDEVADLELIQSDMQFICQSFALPRLSKIGPVPSTIIVSLASKKGEFGVYDPGITEYFESFSVKGGECKWELF